MNGSPHKIGAVQGTNSAMKMVSAFKQSHEDMYEVEQRIEAMETRIEEDSTNKELQVKLEELVTERNNIHKTLKGGNINPGYDEDGNRDKSLDTKYPK